jgi:site-specific DNA recombinase
MMLNILMSFSQHEREIIAERIKDKVVASKRRGMWLGGYVPFGYYAENKKLYPHSQEAPIVKRIFDRFVETQSPKLIALELNQEGIFPRTGNLWKVPYISRIIANRIYIGEIFYNDEIIPGIHKAIIDRDVWERAQEIVKSNNPYDRAGGAAELIVPLKGLLRCGHCGCVMKPVFTTRGKKRYYYYYCDQDTKRAEKCCPIGKIGSATIEDAVKDQTKKIFETTYFQEHLAAQTGITINELMELFQETFWQESNPQELNRLYSELFEKIILKENQIVYEIKTSGVQALIEGVTNEHQ